MENSQKKPVEMKVKTEKLEKEEKELEKQDWLKDPDWLEYRAIREEERRNDWSRNSF